MSVPEQVKDVPCEEVPENDKVSSAEITLKSATLPRRKTTKAEIKLEYPTPKPASMEFKTEMAHRVEGVPGTAQRSEVVVPISSRPIRYKETPRLIQRFKGQKKIAMEAFFSVSVLFHEVECL